MSRRELLLGCGSNHAKQMARPPHTEWSDLTTLDNNPEHKPDKLWDLENLPLPFDDNEFDEVHAYNVIEHCSGQQGDAKAFFNLFSELWRILKPDGLLFGIVPAWNSQHALGDPSHRRIISNITLSFLRQTHYKQVGITASSDFRNIYHADFEIDYCQVQGDAMFFVLITIKPQRS